MHIGIDVGGTNTDAVVMNGDKVVAATKSSTTADINGGIVTSLAQLRDEGSFAAGDVTAVMIGTTHFVNALVEATRLAPVAAVRLGLPATSSMPPFTGWPTSLVDAVRGESYLCHGGHEFNGREISPLDPDELRRIAADISARGLRSVAISSVFSPINSELEQRALEIMAAELPDDVTISLSHEIGRIGLLERENATIINAALRELARGAITGIEGSLREFGILGDIFLSANDGTLVDLESATRYPVMTFASGPTNSMRGAALLTGLEEAVVVDIGGTTADVGVLQSGFPRESSVPVSLAGIRTNFRMPDLVSLGIGGGSLIDPSAEVSVGPRSTGYRLTSEALVFGGDTITATDCVVAAGRATIGDPARVAHLDPRMVRRALDEISERVARVVDRMRVTPEPLPVVAVGGGSILLPDTLPGAGEVVRPPRHEVANAIGAASAMVGGEVDRICPAADEAARIEARETAKQDATYRAILAGAEPDTVQIVDFGEMPVPYLPGNAIRVHAKAVGSLKTGV